MILLNWKLLNEDYVVCLVGLTKAIKTIARRNIGIEKQIPLNSGWNLFNCWYLLNSYQDTFPTTNIEALCGASIDFTGGSPSIIDTCGRIVEEIYLKLLKK